MKMEKGVRRCLLDISEWNPSPGDFASALSLLRQHEHSSIIGFVRMEDKKRALVSRMLQYALVHQVLGLPYEGIIISRTLEGKPYLECDKIGSMFPNFNFNVSHHGDYVAISSEPLCLVGLDIVSPIIPQGETVPEFIQNFSSSFSSLEWNNIVTAGADAEVLLEFYRYWCLKEAYVKAIGCGLSIELDKVEFQHDSWTNISVKVNGVIMTKWRFWLVLLKKGHLASIARGHPRYACKSYKRVLTQVDFTEEEYNEAFHLSNPSFVLRTVEEVIAVLMKAKTPADDQKI